MLARVHALLGLIPLGGYLAYHVYGTWPVLHSRELWVMEHRTRPSMALVITLVLVPLLLHAVLGLFRLLRTADAPLNGPRGLRVLQAVTGLLALGFVALHVSAMWAASEGPHADARAAYQALFHAAGRPQVWVPYLIGITALCFHVGHGIARAAVSLRLARTPKSVFGFRTFGFALGAVLWALLLQLLAQFAIGQPLL